METRSLNSEELRILGLLISEGCHIALHGLTHRSEPDLGFLSEFCGISMEQAEHRILQGIEILTSKGLPTPTIFIPPFNTFDEKLFPMFRNYFDVVIGGPESVWHAPGKAWVSSSPNHFYCSLPPLYGHGKMMLDTLLKSREHWFEGKWLTLHWAWEYQGHYNNLKKLLVLIKDNIYTWEEFRAEQEKANSFNS